MADEIKIYDDTPTLIDTLTTDVIDLTFSSTGIPRYLKNTTTYDIDHLTAELDSSSLTVRSTTTGLTVNGIRATAGANAQEVSSRLSWGTNTATGAFELVFSTPAVSQQELEWTIGDGVPPIKLTVKIIRK